MWFRQLNSTRKTLTDLLPVIRREIKLEQNVHGTSFNRNREGKLVITFKLVSNLTMKEVQQTVKKYFCINKISNEGHHNKVSGEVVHPKLEDQKSDQKNFNLSEKVDEKKGATIN